MLKILSTFFKHNKKPKASDVLSCYLIQRNEPEWTSFFVALKEVNNDQFGKSHFNWHVGNSNYHILRVGCYPYIKYHCTKRYYQDLSVEDIFFRAIKIMNLGIPCLLYGVAAKFLIKHKEQIVTPYGSVNIYFLIEERRGSLH